LTLRDWVNEAVATALLLATVVGSGIMAERLSGGNDAVALLGNTIATAAMLPVLIWTFRAPAMNPAVTLVLRGPWLAITAQVVGAVLGVWLAHAMFEAPVWQLGIKPRAGWGQWLAEFTATFALLTVVLRTPAALVAPAVGLVVAAGYWFTASTSFANPAVTLARGLTDSFSGIAPGDVAPFILAQLAGAFSARAYWAWQDQSAKLPAA
jgi:glycerol uptake facilitator-like aquaporin